MDGSGGTDSKNRSLALAVNLGQYEHDSMATVKQNAVLDAMGDVYVQSDLRLPWEIQFHQINGVGDLLD